MNTSFLLMAQYNGKAVIPADEVCRDYFPHLDTRKFLRKIAEGQLPLPLVKIESSQKSAKGVHLHDLAEYLDRRREEAARDFAKMYG